MLKTTIEKDLKAAMLEGDKHLVSILRSLKSAILYKELEEDKRGEGLSDEELVSVLKKERKSRKDALDLYEKAKEDQKAEEERYQIGVISGYLPEELSEEQLTELTEDAISSLGLSNPEQKDMGKIIGKVKAEAKGDFDGATLAKVIKGFISK